MSGPHVSFHHSSGHHGGFTHHRRHFAPAVPLFGFGVPGGGFYSGFGFGYDTGYAAYRSYGVGNANVYFDDETIDPSEADEYADAPVIEYQGLQRSLTYFARRPPPRQEGESLTGAGRRHMRAGDYATAADLFFQAAADDSDAAEPRLLLTHALAATGDFAFAAYALRLGLDQIDVDDVPADRIGDLYPSVADYRRMLDAVHEFVRENDQDPNAHLIEAYLRYFAGHRRRAGQAVETVLQLDPDDRHAKRLRTIFEE